MSDERNSPEVIGYYGLRRWVGVLGMAFPVLLAFGWGHVRIEPSLSAYYDTPMRDWFVGLLFAIGLFLVSCRGYDARDATLGVLAFVFAVGVAVFPASGARSWLHFACAAALFVVLAMIALFQFTQTGGQPTREKLARNRIYRTCGVLILVFVVLTFVYDRFLASSALARFQPVFWLESLALWSFGIAWLTKGEMLTILSKDPSPAPE